MHAARRVLTLAILPLACVCLALLCFPARAADPSTLWNIIHSQCVPHEQADDLPAPCALVELQPDIARGYAVLKDINGIAQFLLLPTERIEGIEDPAILAQGQTNYWQAAWQARHFVEERLHTALPRDALSLAINSKFGRTQNQLHIHIDCISPQVHDILAAHLGSITPSWSVFPQPLAGHSYRALRILQPTLAGADPFRILAETVPQPDMGSHTLVLTGAKFDDGADGFILLDDQADLAAGNFASGEQLQDHRCAIAAK